METIISKQFNFCIVLYLSTVLLPIATAGTIGVHNVTDIISGIRVRRAAKAPSVPTAPLDPNETVGHTLEEVNQILGSVGGAASGLVMGLTGISITDCAHQIKNEDLESMTCAQFINAISKCDSLSHIKPLLQQAKQKYKKNPNSKAPCFSKKKGKKNGK